MNSGNLAVTYASTPDRLPIGKRWRPQGKWPVEAGVRQTSFLFERVVYDGLEALAADLRHRISEGTSAIVAGVPKPGLDLARPQRRANENFDDPPQWLLALDVDGLPPSPGEAPLDTPEAFMSGRACRALMKLLPAPFRKAGFVAYATGATGFDPDSSGKPTEGRARFRIIFVLWKPLPLAEQKRLVARLKQQLPFLDTEIYSPSHWHFIKRPTLPKGRADPIPNPVRFEAGATLDPSAVFMILGVDPNHDPYKDHENAGRLLEVFDEDREPLLRRLMGTLPNDIVDRTKWIGVGHALRGACAGAPYGLDIWLEYCVGWTKGVDDPEEDERVWNTLYDGKAGINHLIKLALKTGTREALEAVKAIRRAQREWRQQQAQTAFDDKFDGPPDEPTGSSDDENKPTGSSDDDKDDGDDDKDDDDALLARRAPTIDPRAFYGPLARIVTETTKESEATKVGVAAQIMARVSLALRPFYIPLGDVKIGFNVYILHVGLSGKGRKGTSSAIADNFLEPAFLRLAHAVKARNAFPDKNEDARNEAEAEVEETAQKLNWTRNVDEDQESEIEARLATLREDRAAAMREIAERKARLKAKARAYRTVREQEKLIAAAEAKSAENARLIAADEVELIEVRRVLKDPTASLRRAQAAYDAAEAELSRLPPQAPPAPWIALFASLAEGPVTTTGVSTGEGLIELIRDPGQKQGLRGPVDDPGVANKCLFLNLDEFGSVLAVIMRPGATLSSVLRTMWDCRRTELINKNSSSRCKEPYVTMSASITPGELMGRLFDKRDAASSADNGLGNRLLYLWVKRDKLKARPLATPGLDAMMDTITGNVLSVYQSLNPAGAFLSTPIDFSAAAYRRYELEYLRIANLEAASKNADKLVERLPVYLRKIAGILAVTNGEHEISEGALEAAIAWVEYAAGTVNAIAATASERKKTRILADDGETILTALRALGGDVKPVSSREVQRKTGLDKKPFDAAIGKLLQKAPASITISEDVYTSGRGVRRTRALLSLNTAALLNDVV